MTTLLTDNLPLLAGAPNGIKKLRELILELAVRGKLVPQEETDEPASKLLERIAKENAQLVSEGRIKKLKVLTEVGEEEKSFDLPKTWSWARLGELVDIVYGKGLPTSELTNDGYEVFGANGVIGYYSSYLYAEPQLLVSCRGAYSGKPNISPSYCFVTSNSLVLQNSWKNLSLKFFFYSLSIAEKEEIVTGSAQPQVTTTNLDPFLVVVPPLAEQHRIVVKVDELMALCDRLEAQQADAESAHVQLVQALLNSLTQAIDATDFAVNWQRLAEHFHTLFTTEPSIDALKQTLLQLAMMGKLVPQDPNDEPASALIERIEKEKLTDKSKKHKSLNQIGLNGKLVALPTDWEWVCLGDVVEVTSSKRINVSDYVSDGVPFFRSKEIGELSKGKDISTDIFISSDRYEALKEMSGFPHKNDLMLTSVGSIGNTWLCDGRDFYYKDGNITKLRGRSTLNMRYVQLFIASSLFMRQVIDTISGTAYSALTIIKLNGINFPLAPIPEQHRIVAKVDQLMALCDQLKTRLTQARQLNEQLASTLVEQAVA